MSTQFKFGPKYERLPMIIKLPRVKTGRHRTSKILEFLSHGLGNGFEITLYPVQGMTECAHLQKCLDNGLKIPLPASTDQV